MATYSPSKITKDGNTYNFTDANAVPRSGGAVLTGWLFARTVNDSHATYCGGNSFDNGASVRMHGKDYIDSHYAGTVLIRAQNNSDYFDLFLKPDGTAKWGNKNLAMQEDVVPRSGGAVLTGTRLSRNTNNSEISIDGGNGFENGATIALYGKNMDNYLDGSLAIFLYNDVNSRKEMRLYPDGTWTWNGTACQITSDQRLKQQIAEIDDALLDAWEDVNLVQFKYNDAVEEKGNTARLHTGYVVQQIDEACKKHNVDISAYGLYCHEEYPEETEEVEVEQADGTKTKERKVIREASEHYSLRYTEALIVECAYLRKKNKELQEQLDKLSARLDKLEGVQTK